MADVFHFADGKDDGMATEGVEITRFNQVILTSIAQTFFWSIERFIFNRRTPPVIVYFLEFRCSEIVVTTPDNNFLCSEIYLLNIPCF
jgi:hypothetical protein